ncbi:MAG: GTP-binding protein [Candidatus Lokiarchaeota archaeon]|nr:GTP-binding protein [Candidatus Harpocratesius repetitus]
MTENEEEFSNDFIFKLCVIGAGAAGKTSLIKRFTQGSFNKDYIKTLGAQFSRYETIINRPNGEKVRARLFLWDIAGQDQFKFMRPTFYNGAKACIVVYDLTREETMYAINDWVDDFQNYCGELPMVVFANKSDLIDESTYDDSKIKEIVEKRKFLGMYMTSAKTGKHVHDAFNAIIDVLVEQALDKG